LYNRFNSWLNYPQTIPITLVILLKIEKQKPRIGTAYAVWTGIGAVGVAILGIIFLGEPVSLYRITFLLLIIAGVVGLKFIG